MSAGLAQRLFDGTHAQTRAEDETCEFLWKVLGMGAWQDFTNYYYDRSIEIFSVTPGLILTEEQQAVFWEAGFDRVWTHEDDARSSNETGEHYYARPKGAKMVDFHCPHDGAVLTPAIELCPTCGDEFTGPHGTAIKQRIEMDTTAAIVRWLRSRAPHDGGNIDTRLADAIERGEWRKKL